MSELEQAEKAYKKLWAEYEAAGGLEIENFEYWDKWQCRLTAIWDKVLVLRGYATQNEDGTGTIHNTGGTFSASGEAI